MIRLMPRPMLRLMLSQMLRRKRKLMPRLMLLQLKMLLLQQRMLPPQPKQMPLPQLKQMPPPPMLLQPRLPLFNLKIHASQLSMFPRSKWILNLMLSPELLIERDITKPRVAIHTWELYDNAFSFPKVRRYEDVQHHLELLQHFEDNLNGNFTSGQHVSNFITVAKAAQDAMNAKYHNGEFADPASFDPEADHPVTWSNVKL